MSDGTNAIKDLRATDELGKDSSELVEGGLGELTGTDSGILSGVSGKSLLPAFGETALDTTRELGGLLGVLVLVRLEESVPLGVELGTLLGELAVVLGDLLGDGKGLLGVEAKLGLELSNVVLLEGSTVNVVATLLLGTETDRGPHADKSGLVLVLLALLDGSGDTGVVAKGQLGLTVK